MSFPEKQKLALSQADLVEIYDVENIQFGELEGSVFVMNNDEIGMSSLHFDKGNGPYISHEHEKCFNKKLLLYRHNYYLMSLLNLSSLSPLTIK